MSPTSPSLVQVGAELDALTIVLAPVFAAALASVHLFAGRLRFLDVIPRSRWLSAAGGVSVAYVFVHVFPEIERAAETIERSNTLLRDVENHVYLVVLLGFGVFYGLDHFVRDRTSGGNPRNGETDVDVFWLHIGSFAIYNALVGYLLLHREATGPVSLFLFGLAMALHFLVNDYGLREYHGHTYRQYGRWVLAVAVFAGLGVGYVVRVDELFVSVLFAFLAGGIILNVIKEELPEERESRFWAFAVGVIGYSVLLLLI